MPFWGEQSNKGSVKKPEYPQFSDELKKNIGKTEDTEWDNVIIIADQVKYKSQGFFSKLVMGDDEDPTNQSAFTWYEAAELVRRIANIPDQQSINIFLHTLGGQAFAMEMINRALINHSGTVRVFVPQYAFSAGTYIALVADELYMDSNAVLGPMDLQVSGLPLNSIMKSLTKHQDKEGYIHTYLDSHLTKIKNDYDEQMESIINRKFPGEDNTELKQQLSVTHHHGHSLTVDALKNLGLTIHDVKVTWENIKDPVKCMIDVINSEEDVQSSE